MRRILTLAIFAAVTLMPGSARACTIFVLTDGEGTLFCNNEDWSNPKTRIWFVPSAKHYGAAYVGFDNGWAQGGVNTAGLAFDWVAGYHEEWKRDPKLAAVRGNPSVLMEETCASVDEAIAFYRGHWEPSFSYAKMLIADRTGASVRIGAKGGQLVCERMTSCRGFGYGENILGQMMSENKEPTPANAFKILRAARQRGEYATKYSNVYDLRSGDIFLYPVPFRDDFVTLNLNAELKKGGHFYDMPEISAELGQRLKPLSEMPRPPWWRFW